MSKTTKATLVGYNCCYYFSNVSQGKLSNSQIETPLSREYLISMWLLHRNQSVYSADTSLNSCERVHLSGDMVSSILDCTAICRMTIWEGKTNIYTWSSQSPWS